MRTQLQLGDEGETLTEEKNDRGMLYAFTCILTMELREHVFFSFLILDAKIPKFTYVKFEKKIDIKLRNGGPQHV